MPFPKITSETEIEQMYSMLPANSLGRLANNPEWFKWFLNPWPYDPMEWPYVMLCKDTQSSSMTWHVVCSDWDYIAFLRSGPKGFVDDRISKKRGKPLESLEIIQRIRSDKYQHWFIGNKQFDQTAYTVLSETPQSLPI